MIIQLSPQINGKNLVVSKKGDSLTINGESFNFTPLSEGSILPASAVDSDFITGTLTRQNGQLMITILMPILADAGEEARFPAPIVNPPDGYIKFPTGVSK